MGSRFAAIGVAFFLSTVLPCARCYGDPIGTPLPPQQSQDSFENNYKETIQKLNGEAIPVASPAPSPESTPLKVVYGDEGIPFPAESEVVLEPVPTQEAEPEPTVEVPATPTPWVKPGRCEKDETLVVEGTSQGNAQRLLYDMLFLSEDLVPLDPDEVFGADVMLRAYGEKTGRGGEVWQEVHEVPCVPYRVRRTETAVRYDFGRNALKNYSANQSGKGTFHPWIEEKLFGGSRPIRRR